MAAETKRMEVRSRKKVLVVASDLATHSDLRRILCAYEEENRNFGGPLVSLYKDLEIESASHGPEGWTRLQESLRRNQPFVLAVIDAKVSGEWDAAETIIRLWSEDPLLPVILYKSNGFTAEERRDVLHQLGYSDRFLFVNGDSDPDVFRQMTAAQIERRLVHLATANKLASLQRDLERAQLDLRESMQTKNEFLANISHEIRTPMNAILGFTHLLLKEPLTEPQLEKLHYVQNAGDSLMIIIDGVLDFAKLSAGQLRLAITPFELESVLNDVASAAGPLAQEKGLAVDHQVISSSPRWFCGDRFRIRQILWNLVQNAVKFTEHGAVRIQAIIDEETDDSATIRVVVTDTGIGIPTERQKIMFQSFAQADGSLSRHYGGLGLGLAISKQLADLMGGQIGFRSPPGQGSSFWFIFTLPKHQGAKEGDQASTPPTTLNYGSKRSRISGKPNVLVVEGEYFHRTTVELLLGRAGCFIDLAENAQDAQLMLEKNNYDLILLDYALDGLNVIRSIRQREEGASRCTPVVMLAAQSYAAKRVACLEAGADEFVVKPCTPEMLIGTVCHFLPGLQLGDGGQAFEDEDREKLPKNEEECLSAICMALEEENFPQLEKTAGHLKNMATRKGERDVADQATRVLLSARSHELRKTALAVQRLQSVMNQGCCAVPGQKSGGSV